jgi:hypothetical protein
MEGTRTNRRLDAAGGQLSCVNRCRFLHCQNETHQLAYFQAVTLDATSSSGASSKIPKMIV